MDTNRNQILTCCLSNDNNTLNELLVLNCGINKLKERNKVLRRRKTKLRFMILNYYLKIMSLRLEMSKSNRLIGKKIRSGSFFEKDLFSNGEMFFKEHLRMSPQSFDDLCILLPGLEKQETRFTTTISLKKRIAIALYTLGTSAEYSKIANIFGIGVSTVCEILLDFCFEVLKELTNEYLNYYPVTDAKIKQNIKGFENLGFPQCIGAIDSCHIEVKPQHKNANDYCNSKGWHSTILLAVVDYKNDFIYINVGCPGRYNNSVIYEQSSIKSYDINNNIFQKNCKIIKSVVVPPLLIANSSFKLTESVMKPYPLNVEAENSKKIFNYKLSKCRRVVENAFDHLKARFTRLTKGLNNQIKNATMIIKACCVLNNFLNAKKDEVNSDWIEELFEGQRNCNRIQPDDTQIYSNTNNGILIRNAISLYFMDGIVGTGFGDFDDTVDIDGDVNVDAHADVIGNGDAGGDDNSNN